MNIVIVGHVDHGKSTVIGRLLADTGSLPEGKLEQIREMCRRSDKPFEYAFLLDALKDERSQGITIDTARCFFKTEKRQYIIIDAPGHIEFLKNMITGASRAEAALLVIDAHEGIRENSRRHGYMLSMLGIKQIAVLVNKMDLVNYDRGVYDSIVAEYSEFLRKIDITPSAFIPVSAMAGDNITTVSANMPWYSQPDYPTGGRTVLEELDDFVENESEADKLSFRMPVQDVYKFTGSGDDRRIVAGTIESGSIRVGDGVTFYPSGKSTRVKSIETFNTPGTVTERGSGWSVGFTMDEQIYVRRGELAVKNGEKAPKVGCRFKCSLFWLGKASMVPGKSYHLKIGSAKVGCRLAKIVNVLDASDLSGSKKSGIDRYDVADCVIECDVPVAYDLTSEMPSSSRFVIVDAYEIAGGGIITASLSDELDDARELVMRRNDKWEQSAITSYERATRFGQRAAMIIITGNRSTGKKAVAKLLERQLFDAGRNVYFLGIGNVLYGVVADIKTTGEVPQRREHIRRLGEVANLMMDNGTILLVTAAELTAYDIDVLKTTVDEKRIHTVWLGCEITTDIEAQLHIADIGDNEQNARRIREYIEDKGIVFKP